MNFDPYEALGVSKDTSQDDIKKAYRKLARKHHPDVNPGDKEAEEKFKTISEAYDILGDKTKRAEYDRLGQQAFYDQAFGGQGYERPDFSHGFSFEDLFGDLFGGGMKSGGFEYRTAGGGPGMREFRTGPRRGGHLSYRLKIGFRDAIFGTEANLDFERPVPCTLCAGQGFNASTGQVCPECGGRGQKTTREQLKTRIPPGVDTGSKVRLAGKGQPGINGGPSGDLFLEIEVGPDPVFSRRGQDIYIHADVNLPDAVLGGQIEVPTLSGRASLKVPAGTQNGAKLRLKGQGVPKTKNKPAGDMYVTLKVLIPKKLNAEAKELFEKLRGLVS